MTSKEAISRIKHHMEIHKLSEPNAIYITEALNMAMQALEKHIPKKPKREPEPFPKHFDKGVYGFHCPVCGEDLLDECSDCFNYCQNCGQAIDWSDEE